MRIREDLLVTKALLRRFQDEAEHEGGSGRYYALIQRDDGDFLSHHPFAPSLDPAQMMWATDMLRLLNRELHHDGAWVVVFTDPQQPRGLSVVETPSHVMFGRYGLIWVDSDGDPQFTQEWVAGVTSDYGTWADVLLAGPISTAEKCAHSWALWSMTREALGLREGETIKRAQGQRSQARH